MVPSIANPINSIQHYSLVLRQSNSSIKHYLVIGTYSNCSKYCNVKLIIPFSHIVKEFQELLFNIHTSAQS